MAEVVWLPGAQDPVNDGERRVIEYLALKLPQDYLLYPGIQVLRGGAADDVDILLVTPYELVVIEVKDIAGHLAIDHGACYVNDERRQQPFNLTNAKARRIKAMLESYRREMGRVWVRPLVVLARRPASLKLNPPTLAESVMVLEDAAALLAEPPLDRDGYPKRPFAQLTKLAIEALSPAPRERDVRFGVYQAVKRLERFPDEEIWQGVHDITGEEVEIRHIGLNPMTRERRVAEARREVEIFDGLRGHPLIEGPREVLLQDDGTLALVYPARKGEGLDELIEAGGEIPKKRIVLDIVTALAAAHEHGVVHGRLAPRWVEVLPDVTRIRGFALRSALVGDAATWVIERDEEFLAPEAKERRAVDPSSDLYSLGVIIEKLEPDDPTMKGLADVLTRRRPDRIPSTDYVREALAEAFSEPGSESAGEQLMRDEEGHLVEGAVVGEYVVDRLLGSGGSSDVYLARHVFGGPPRTVKVFGNGEDTRQIGHEFTTLQEIDDPHVVRVIHSGVSGYGPYLVSEYLEGETLAQRIDAWNGRPDISEALLVVHDLLNALDAIHSRQIYHRDVKPENVIIVEGRGAVLFDFDVAAADHSQVDGFTWAYWPPGFPPGHAGPEPDLFAVGVILHELMTGDHPFPGRNPQDGHAEIGDVPPAVRRILERALSADPANRYATAAEFREAIAPHVDANRTVAPSARDRYRRVEQLIAEGRLEEASELVLPEWKRLVARIERKHRALSSTGEVFAGFQMRFDREVTRQEAGLDNVFREANVREYHVSHGPDLMLDVGVASFEDGTMKVWAVNAYDSPRPFADLVGRMRIGVYPREEDYIISRLRLAVWEGPRPSRRQASLSELNEAAGLDVVEVLLAAGAIDVGKRGEIDDACPSRERNEVAVSMPADRRFDVAMKSYLIATVLPLARRVGIGAAD